MGSEIRYIWENISPVILQQLQYLKLSPVSAGGHRAATAVAKVGFGEGGAAHHSLRLWDKTWDKLLKSRRVIFFVFVYFLICVIMHWIFLHLFIGVKQIHFSSKEIHLSLEWSYITEKCFLR